MKSLGLSTWPAIAAASLRSVRDSRTTYGQAQSTGAPLREDSCFWALLATSPHRTGPAELWRTRFPPRRTPCMAILQSTEPGVGGGD